MHHRSLRRAAGLAVAGLLAFAGAASADMVRSDGDVVSPGAQTFVDLGAVAPGAVIQVEVAFELVCSNVRHVDAGQTISLTLLASQAPAGGAVVSATPASIGPVPADWPAENADCPDPLPVLGSSTSSTVTLRAPTTINVGYIYTVGYARSLSPAGSNDAGALSGTATAVNFRLDVATNTPPDLTVPGDATVEGDTIGGWTAVYAVSATDAQDEPDPVSTCSPAAGSVLPLGTTTVDCTVTDRAGLSDSGSFALTVVDSTAPGLTGVPGDLQVKSASPTGTLVSWVAPTASDVVDAAPAVACLPASGSTFPVGATTVTCGATDTSGNVASASFVVNVDYVPVVTASALWHEPLSSDGGTFSANRGRTVPIKVSLSVDGVARSSGDVSLRLAPCGGGAGGGGVVGPLTMTYSGGRWNVSLDTSTLAGACYVGTASIDGVDAGSFRLELRGAEAAKAKATARPR